MATNNSGAQKRRRFFWTLVAIAALASIIIYAPPQADQESESRVVQGAETVYSEMYSPNAQRTVDENSSERVAQDDILELWLDSQTYGIYVKDSVNGSVWSSLPMASDGESVQRAAVFSVEALVDGDRYILNSQDHCAAMGLAEHELIENGIRVKYLVALSQKDAELEKEFQKALSAGKEYVTDEEIIAFSIDIKYTIKNNSLYAEADLSRAKNKGNVKLNKITLMEWFGAAKGYQKDSCLLVPDGCGAAINLDSQITDFEPLELQTYGADPALEGPNQQSDSPNQCVLPVFGIKRGDEAFAAIIERGDALSVIKADVAREGDNYSKAFAQFEVTSQTEISKTMADENELTLSYESNHSYNYDEEPEIRICYRFLSGSSASVSGFATSCREQFIRNGTLSSQELEATGFLPFNLGVIGAQRAYESYYGMNVDKYEILTTFEQAQDLMEQLSIKGVQNVYLRYTDMLRPNTGMKKNYKLIDELGGARGYRDLYKVTNNLNYNLIFGCGAISGDFGCGASSDFARSIDGRQMSFFRQLNDEGEGIYQALQSVSAETLKENIAAIKKNIDKFPGDGLYVEDAGKILYSNFTQGNYLNRQEASENLKQASESLKVNNKMIVDTGNFYMLKWADMIVNIPIETSREENEYYKSEPLLQMILHGTIDYAGPVINLSEDPDYTALKCIEYGAGLNYEWVYTYSEDSRHYSVHLGKASRLYAKANEALNDLRGQRIVDRYEIAENVFCTQYEGGARTLVNYNDESKTVDGMIVPAKDFVRTQ